MTPALSRWDDLVSDIVSAKAAVKPEQLPEVRGSPRDLAQAIRHTQARGIVPIIGEIKPRSPSEGSLRDSPDPRALVGEMEEADVAGISVLTEPLYFGGSKELLEEASRYAQVPLLRKDFIVHEEEIAESRALGADSVLLIVRLLGNRLGEMYCEALDLGMTPLVEVHTRQEMDQASELEPQIIGINNRDLSDLSIDLETTARLSKHAPKKSLVVSESGYHTRGQVARMEKFCDAFLIGSALMRGSVRGMIHELQGREGEV